MDPFDDFISDDRKTVSEGFSSRKLKFPPTGIHGSRSDNGDRRLSKSSDRKGRKGAISNRTSQLAQLALNGEQRRALTHQRLKYPYHRLDLLFHRNLT